MTLVNVKTRPVNGHFNNFVNDFFAPLPSIIKEEISAASLKHSVPVNVKETETGYELELVVPGFAKEDISISLENNLLTVSGEKKSESDAKLVRSEYQFRSFKRSFSLDKHLDLEAITASHNNGVLLLNLPKKPEVKTTKNISIQ
jgi:HSP20 family protein